MKIDNPTQKQLGVHYLTIDENNENQRLDNFLISYLKKVPKSNIYRIIRKGEVRVNKKRTKQDYRLNINDIVRIPPININITEDNNLEQLLSLEKIKRLDQDIIFEDKDIIVINKYSGIAVHGGSGLSYGVIEALRKLRPHEKFLELVHRIDRDTSGLLLIAKKRSALIKLQQQLVDKTMRKEYIALVKGNFNASTNTKNLLRYEKLNERFVKVDPTGKPSKTNFKIIERFSNYTLIKAMPITGRTHQIRVHCLDLGHVLVGDTKYATRDELAQFKNDLNCNRLFLHAWKLTFTHPKTQERIELEAKLDKDLEKILQKLKP